MKIFLTKVFIAILCMILLTLLPNPNLMAQQNQQMVRLAKIKVDSSQVEKYNAVADKKDPSSITILEIYADAAAYNSHIATPHFKKYKETVKDMVKSLELVDVTLIASARKAGL